MTLLNFFLQKKKNTTAFIAKERLKVLITTKDQNKEIKPYCLKQLQKDIIKVLNKYVQIDQKVVPIKIEQKDENIFIIKFGIKNLKLKN